MQVISFTIIHNSAILLILCLIWIKLMDLKSAKFVFTAGLLLLASIAFSQTSIQSMSELSSVLETAQEINAQGVLRMDKKHYVYLAVSDDFIRNLYPQMYSKLQTKDQRCLLSARNVHGAHVSVFYPNELNAAQITQLPLNKTYTFKVTEIKRINIDQTNKHVVWFVAQIQAPALQQMIDSIHTKKPHDDLHISIAKARYSQDNSCYRTQHE